MTKKLRSALSVGILVVSGGLFAQAALAADFFKIDKCEGVWWVDFWWTENGAQVGDLFILDCSNATDKIDVTRTGAAIGANDYHFTILDDDGGNLGTRADCEFNGEFNAGETDTRKINCKSGPDLLYKGDLKINQLPPAP